ncbi:hypothetical protein [Mycoplasma sp. P36-A1]|uniref:hypothetical protein n=1 Tax=Mycoplasma sp. P36-A1 TaxID=3252900 RepID=UPI003C2FE7D8
MSFPEYELLVDPEEEQLGFIKELNSLLQINTNNDYYIDEEIFGYGLEVEVSAKVSRTHIVFLKTMLNNIINVMNYRGNIVTDRTIKGDYGFEICLDPLGLVECTDVYYRIREIIDFSSGVLEVTAEKACGLHINIKADERIKAEKFKQLFEIIDINDNETFSFNEYKRIIDIPDYDTYLKFQKEVSGKYLAVNLLKNNLIELRCVNSLISQENFVSLLNKIEAIFGGKDASNSTSSQE